VTGHEKNIIQHARALWALACWLAIGTWPWQKKSWLMFFAMVGHGTKLVACTFSLFFVYLG
jgi:hypothetical protein